MQPGRVQVERSKRSLPEAEYLLHFFANKSILVYNVVSDFYKKIF